MILRGLQGSLLRHHPQAELRGRGGNPAHLRSVPFLSVPCRYLKKRESPSPSPDSPRADGFRTSDATVSKKKKGRLRWYVGSPTATFASFPAVVAFTASAPPRPRREPTSTWGDQLSLVWQIGGRFPSSGDGCGWLNLSYNGLSGPIPSELGKLTSLEYVDSSGSELSGCVPVVLKGIRYEGGFSVLR